MLVTRGIPLFPMLVSALCAALLARVAWDNPRMLVPLLAITALMILPALLARRRTRKLLMSGDVQRILGAWAPSFQRMGHAETMTPLFVATAYASCGFVEAGREALGKAARGPIWDASLEQRLVVETLLDTFEGDREASLEKASALENLPAPHMGRSARTRILRLRHGVAALARAFAHQTTDRDVQALREAAQSSPLVYWPMRYAEAVVAIDHGAHGAAAALLEGAPEWPTESAFHAFDAELRAHATAA